MDRIIQGQNRDGIPGVAIAVVSKDGVVVTKGYGHANVGEGIAVDPDRTLLRVGSISKLFVWTAVMQLVETGHLDLDTDINKYLDFEIPNRLYGRAKSSVVAPITLKHLMTHSAEFEDVPEDLFHLAEDQALAHLNGGALYHMGSVLIFNSGMYLLPDSGVGLFVSYNGGSHMAPIELFREFMNAYLSDDPSGTVVPVSATIPTLDLRGDRALTGEYHINRRSFTTDAGLLSLLETLHVDVDDSGTMYVTRFGQTEKFVRVEPGMYRNVAPKNSVDPYGAFRPLIFREGPGGEIQVFPLPMVILGAVMTILVVPIWRKKHWGIGGRIHYTLVTLLAWVLLAILHGWHVI